MLTFDDATHTYSIDGVVVPSVTEITRFLHIDTVSAYADKGGGRWQRDRAADRGTRVHAYCADYDYGVLPDAIAPDCAKYVQAYIDFLRDYRIKEWAAVEVPLGYDGYAGTLDRLGYIDGTLTLVDLKTGAHINKAALAAQLSGYLPLCFHNGLGLPRRLLGVQLLSTGKYRPYECEYSPALFAACKLLHKTMEDMK